MRGRGGAALAPGAVLRRGLRPAEASETGRATAEPCLAAASVTAPVLLHIPPDRHLSLPVILNPAVVRDYLSGGVPLPGAEEWEGLLEAEGGVIPG